MSKHKHGKPHDDDTKSDFDAFDAATPAPEGAEPEPVADAPEPDAPEPKPAVVHGPPHLGRVTHVAGEDVPEPEAAEETPEGERKPTPVVSADNVAVIYGLRKAGRLYRCSITGLGVKLIEADSPEQAKEAYCADVCHERGAEPPVAKGDRVKGKREHKGRAETLVRPEAGPTAAPTPPPGYVAIVPAESPFVKVAPELVRCVKLTA